MRARRSARRRGIEGWDTGVLETISPRTVDGRVADELDWPAAAGPIVSSGASTVAVSAVAVSAVAVSAVTVSAAAAILVRLPGCVVRVGVVMSTTLGTPRATRNALGRSVGVHKAPPAAVVSRRVVSI